MLINPNPSWFFQPVNQQNPDASWLTIETIGWYSLLSNPNKLTNKSKQQHAKISWCWLIMVNHCLNYEANRMLWWFKQQTLCQGSILFFFDAMRCNGILPCVCVCVFGRSSLIPCGFGGSTPSCHVVTSWSRIYGVVCALVLVYTHHNGTSIGEHDSQWS